MDLVEAAKAYWFLIVGIGGFIAHQAVQAIKSSNHEKEFQAFKSDIKEDVSELKQRMAYTEGKQHSAEVLAARIEAKLDSLTK